ncbi:angiotensin-converting enzyme [Aplysia californica]|uniref:Angiotensin-converting enzyme n=1 Tax=Aplysia californica TaxID=6500 RepID=A0ABM1A0N7_APLCA|nr:angiotensin-converting enzyme [Aplysia californica]
MQPKKCSELLLLLLNLCAVVSSLNLHQILGHASNNTASLGLLLQSPQPGPMSRPHWSVLDDVYTMPGVASDFLRMTNRELMHWKHQLATTQWDYVTNMTRHNERKVSAVSERYQAWRATRRKEARKFHTDYLPDYLARQLKIFSLSATSEDAKVARRTAELQSEMTTSYASSSVCLINRSCLSLDSGLADLMARSRDPLVLQEVWLAWRDVVGPAVKDDYTEFVSLLNAGARENGFRDYSRYWREDLFFQTPDLDGMLDHLWQEVKPLYLQLHAYVRRKLRQTYGSDVMGTDGTIPAHLLGDMWAQHWGHVWDIVSPYPEVDKKGEMEARLKRGSDVTDLFRATESFYVSLGMQPMSRDFWNFSMFTRPPGAQVDCHASSYDMFYPGDFRLKMCTEVSLGDFWTAHHEMGHIQYFMAYADQPAIFREGANSAFHEALGDTIQLSAMTDRHLRYLGLQGFPHADEYDDDDDNSDDDNDGRKDNIQNEIKRGRFSKKKSRQSRQYIWPQLMDDEMSSREKRTVNKLLSQALEKIAFLPFGYLVDLWRWGVMSGDITPQDYNRRWWELRLQYQGVRSPVPRSEADFDPGAKYHIPAHSPYISYFVSYSLQFQLLESLCRRVGHQGALHTCDLTATGQRAGWILRNVLSAGSSRPWQDQLSDLTGSRKVSSSALMEYFLPLHRWLERENSLYGETIGWDEAEINW